MKIAYFDCQFGAAGDMLIGAMLDAGLNQEAWLSEVAKIALPPGSFEIKISKVHRQTLAATKMDVLLQHTHKDGHAEGHVHSHDHGLSNSHAHSHLHEHEHEREHEHKHSHSHEHGGESHEHDHSHEHAESQDKHDSQHRREHGPAVAMSYIQNLIDDSAVSKEAKSLAHKVILRLGRCEGIVHGMSDDAVYFHEVGAVDSIVDIVGFAVAYDLMKIEKSYVSAVPIGRGYVSTAHGHFPVPAPAVVQILSQIKAPTLDYAIDFECLTPTGAAILAEICQKWGRLPAFDEIHATGYGAGTKDSTRHPNVCRIITGNGTGKESENNPSESSSQTHDTTLIQKV